MDGTDFTFQLKRLCEGNAKPQEITESGITIYASSSMYELMEYTKALEQGYRTIWARLLAYRTRAGGKTIGELVENQWSDGGCFGYALMAMRQLGYKPDEIVSVMDCMADIMESVTVKEAEEAARSVG